MRKTFQRYGALIALLLVAVGAFYALGIGLANAIPYHPAKRTPHELAIEERTTADATCQYWVSDEGVAAVVVTSGVNCSKTASFTIKASPYDGATFRPSGGLSAFNVYLQQIGQGVSGPGYSGVKAPPLKKIAGIDNVYTNHRPTAVYVNPAHDNGAAAAIKDLLETGLPW